MLFIKILKAIHQKFLKDWPNFIGAVLGLSFGTVSALRCDSVLGMLGYLLLGGVICVAVIVFLLWIRQEV